MLSKRRTRTNTIGVVTDVQDGADVERLYWNGMVADVLYYANVCYLITFAFAYVQVWANKHMMRGHLLRCLHALLRSPGFLYLKGIFTYVRVLSSSTGTVKNVTKMCEGICAIIMLPSWLPWMLYKVHIKCILLTALIWNSWHETLSVQIVESK